jgi:hypothetical protein
MNLKQGGGWLPIEEIFHTGAEHMFAPKRPGEIGSRKRPQHGEEIREDDPAHLVCIEVGRVDQGEEMGTFTFNQP